jgi:hypothetical protein
MLCSGYSNVLKDHSTGNGHSLVSTANGINSIFHVEPGRKH